MRAAGSAILAARPAPTCAEMETEMTDDERMQVFDQILERIAEGESLNAICRDADMPNKATVFKWLAADDQMSDRYTRARQAQADTMADAIVEIADTVDDVARARVMIDARKWMAGKLRPSVYSDRHLVEMGGPGGGPVIERIERIIVDPRG